MTKRLAHWITSAATTLAIASALAPAQAADFAINLSGMESRGALASPDNVVLSFDVAPGSIVDNVSWSLNLDTVAGSWLSEATILLRNSAGGGAAFAPAWGSDGPGSGSYSGTQSLAAGGLAFAVLGDGKLFIEFYETYDDIVGGADALYSTGSLTLANVAAVPEPANVALMSVGLAGIAAAMRRRRARD